MNKEIEFIIRVELPSSGSYACCPSGDTEYEDAYHKAILDKLPKGFEVVWTRQHLWTKDKDGYTWILCRCINKDDSLAATIEELNATKKELDTLKQKIKKLSKD